MSATASLTKAPDLTDKSTRMIYGGVMAGDRNIDGIHVGDSAEMLKGLPDARVDMVFVDPPMHDNYLGVWKEIYRVLKDTGVCWFKSEDLYNGNRAQGRPWAQVHLLEKLGWTCRQDCILSHTRTIKDPNPRPTKSHDFIFMLTKSDNYHYRRIPELDKSVWHIQDDEHIDGFGYLQTPVALLIMLVRMTCPDDGVVLDPFLGSGTTGIACNQLGVGWVGVEKSPEYAELARKRIAACQTR